MQQPPQGRQPGPYRPPQGTPPPGNRPGGPPGGPNTPPQFGPATSAGPSYPQSYPPPMAAPFTIPPPRRKKRGSLRFVANSCVFSAWATLILSVLMAVGSFLAGAGAAASAAHVATGAKYFPAPTSPGSPGFPGATTGIPGTGRDELGDLGVGSMGNGPLGGANPLGGMDGPGAMMGLLQPMIPAICFASGALTLVSGIVGFILFLGMAQACFALLDLEDQSFQMAQTLSTIVARLGSGQPGR